MNLSVEFSTKTEAAVLIDRLRTASFSSDYKEMIRIFEPLWDIKKAPDFLDYDRVTQAELLMMAGSFLVYFGKAKNLRNYQEKGKDVLTRALNLFMQGGSIEMALECQMLMAVGYFHQGSIEEYHTLLDDAEKYFKNKKTHPVYLWIQVNYLVIEISRREIKSALFRINRIFHFVEVSTDLRVKTSFFTQAGIVFRQWEEYEQSLEYLTRAMSFAKAIENLHFEALITNCLANTYRSMEQYDLALENIEKALCLGQTHEGWTAHFLDTKANIHFDLSHYEQASEIADEAIKKFKKGDDFGGLIEALWTQMRIHLKLDLREIAFKYFFELYSIANQRIGSKTANRYLTEYLEMVYINVDDGSFADKVDQYKKFLVQNALFQTRGKIVEAAKLLGIRKHQTLSKMIHKNFPEVLDDYQIARKERSDKISK